MLEAIHVLAAMLKKWIYGSTLSLSEVIKNNNKTLLMRKVEKVSVTKRSTSRNIGPRYS